MRSTSVVLLFASLLAPFVAADLHTAAVCIDSTGGASVYNEAATKAACENYKARNTGNAQWDQCPDCEMVSNSLPLWRDSKTDCEQRVVSDLNVCHSEGKHIGGDEINHYCTKVNGAADSVAN